jgi:hypothetical protein
MKQPSQALDAMFRCGLRDSHSCGGGGGESWSNARARAPAAARSLAAPDPGDRVPVGRSSELPRARHGEAASRHP